MFFVCVVPPPPPSSQVSCNSVLHTDVFGSFEWLCCKLKNYIKFRRMNDEKISMFFSLTALGITWAVEMPVPWWGNTWWCSGPSHISYMVVKLCICYFQWMYLVQKRSFIPLQVVFRSTSAMVYIFIQMSCEMWDFDIYGTWLTGLPDCEWQELSFLSVLWNCCYDVFLPPLEN